MDRRRAKKDLRKILSILKKEKIAFVDVLVFGSFAKGFATEHSDLDLCIVSNADESQREIDLAKLTYKAGLANLNVDISGLSESDFRKNGWSTFVHEVKSHGIPAKLFLE